MRTVEQIVVLAKEISEAGSCTEHRLVRSYIQQSQSHQSTYSHLLLEGDLNVPQYDDRKARAYEVGEYRKDCNHGHFSVCPMTRGFEIGSALARTALKPCKVRQNLMAPARVLNRIIPQCFQRSALREEVNETGAVD